jgi:protein-disulfide isomerase
MNMQTKTALLGGAIGAVLSITAVFGAATLGFFPPPSDKQFERYLMAHPSIVIAMAEKAQNDQTDTEQRQFQASIDKNGLKTYFNPQVAFVTGPANAKNTFVKKFYEAHKGDTRFAFIELPIFGKESDNAARAALAARKQPDKYVAFHFAMMSEPGAIDPSAMIDAAHKAGLDVNRLTADVKDPALNRQMAAAHALAARTGINGTPFFIINGKGHEGEVDEALLNKVSRS